MGEKKDIAELRSLLVKYNTKKEYIEYTKMLREIIKLFPNSYDGDLAIYEMGVYKQTKENNHKEAIKWFNNATKSKFEDICVLAKMSLGMCYFKNNCISQAREIFSEITLKHSLSSQAETAKIMLENLNKRNELRK